MAIWDQDPVITAASAGQSAAPWASDPVISHPAFAPVAPGNATDAAARASADYAAQRTQMAAGRRAFGASNPLNDAIAKVPILGPLLAHDEHGVSAGDFASPLPLQDEFAGGVNAAGRGIMNMIRAAQGKPQADVRTAYLAGKDDEQTALDSYRQAHPYIAGGMSIAAGLPTAELGLTKLAAAGTPGALDELTAAAQAAAGGVAKKSLARKAGDAVVRAVQGGAVGAAYNAAYQGADADGGLPERGQAAAEGLVPGALAGGALSLAGDIAAPVIAKVGKGVMGAVSDAARALTTPPPVEGAPPVVTQAHLDTADDLFSQMLGDVGLISPEEAASRSAARFDQPGLTSAEMMGRNGIGAATTLARRPGATADLIEGQLAPRNAAQPEGILSDAQTQLGVEPAAAQGDIDAIVAQGQKAAAPLFDQALGGPAPAMTPELAAVAQRPAVRDAMRVTARNLMNEGDTAGAASLADNAPAAPAAAGPSIVDRAINVLRRGGSGSSATPSTGPSLLDFLSRGDPAKGIPPGLSDPGGELSNIDADKWHLGQPFRNRLINPEGSTVGDAAVRAQEAGYLPERAGEGDNRAQPQDLLDAIQKELAGKPQYARPSMAQDQDLEAHVADLGELFDHLGLDPKQESAANLKRAMSEFFGGNGEDFSAVAANGAPGGMQPSAKAWDMIRKAVAGGMERSPLTGAALPDSVAPGNYGVGRAAGDLTQLLRDAIPGYDDALDTAGNYLSQKASFERAKGNLMGPMSTGDFGKAWAAAKTPADKQAFLAGAVSDLFTLAQRGLLRGNRVTIPQVQGKLELMVGKPKAAEFVQRVASRAQSVRDASRMLPGINSTTGEVAGFTADQNDSAARLGLMAKAGVKAAGGHPFQAAFDLTLGGAMRALSYSKTTGMPVQVRDALGRRLMMDRDELQAFIRSRAGKMGRNVTPPPASAVTGGAAGAFTAQGRQ